LFNKPIDVTGSLYDTKIYYVDYTVQRVGFDLTFTKEFGEYWYASLGTSIQKVTYSDISSSAPPVIQSQAGTWQARKLIFSVSHNTTDYYLFPSKGSIQSLTYTIALPVLGGSEKFQKVVLSNANFIKDHIFYTGTILSARETVGWAQAYSNSVVPLDDEFFVGGDYTIRGYSYGYAGPLDSADEPIGATREIVLNFEADYPLYKNIFYVDAFYDTGRGADSWSGLKPSNWLGSYGVGIRFITSYAPVRLDLCF
jgi:Outer membrane protein/protective antigen OMA87